MTSVRTLAVAMVAMSCAAHVGTPSRVPEALPEAGAHVHRCGSEIHSSAIAAPELDGVWRLPPYLDRWGLTLELQTSRAVTTGTLNGGLRALVSVVGSSSADSDFLFGFYDPTPSCADACRTCVGSVAGGALTIDCPTIRSPDPLPQECGMGTGTRMRFALERQR